MKKKLLSLCLICAAGSIAYSFKAPMHVDTYKVDVNASKVEWFAEKVTGKHNGTVKISNGTITNNHGQLGGNFVMDMTTINVSDLQGEKKTKLEGHLKSDDFFGVQKFATSSFEIVSIAPLSGVVQGEPNFKVTGKLTIKGVTQEISFPALIKFEGSKMTTKAELKIDRTKFNIHYGSKTIYEDIGDKAIYDEFILKIDLLASK